jgi:hypothetical protein
MQKRISIEKKVINIEYVEHYDEFVVVELDHSGSGVAVVDL